MRVSKCMEVFVRFNSPNHHGVRISYTNGDSRSQYLKVENDGVTLSVKFCDKDGDTVREINYNYAHVLEYDCEGYLQ